MWRVFKRLLKTERDVPNLMVSGGLSHHLETSKENSLNHDSLCIGMVNPDIVCGRNTVLSDGEQVMMTLENACWPYFDMVFVMYTCDINGERLGLSDVNQRILKDAQRHCAVVNHRLNL